MIICWITSTNGMPATIQVGGLFSEDELEQQLVFHAVIERINNNSNQTFFQPEIFTVKKANSYDANSKSMYYSMYLMIYSILIIDQHYSV